MSNMYHLMYVYKSIYLFIHMRLDMNLCMICIVETRHEIMYNIRVYNVVIYIYIFEIKHEIMYNM